MILNREKKLPPNTQKIATFCLFVCGLLFDPLLVSCVIKIKFSFALFSIQCFVIKLTSKGVFIHSEINYGKKYFWGTTSYTNEFDGQGNNRARLINIFQKILFSKYCHTKAN